MQDSIEELEYICKLVFNLYKIPVYLFDQKEKLIYEESLGTPFNPVYPPNKALLNQLFSETKHYQFPILKETVYLEKFFSINLFANNQFNGNIIVGPILNFKMTTETIDGIFRDLDINVSKEDMVQYYNQLTVLNNFDYINMCMVLHFMIYHKKINMVDILEKNEQLEKKRIELENVASHITEQRQNNQIHTDISVEKKMFDYIKLGQSNAVREAFHSNFKQGKLGILSKTSYLRSQKNLGIVAISLATRAAVEGGLFQEVAYNLSDLYIQKLEELTEIKPVIQLMEHVLVDFAERVANSIKYKFSKPINLCLNYIFTNLYEDITLDTLAELTSLNPNYLSALFKKEVGISIRQYIHNSKVDEAKNLLNYTNYTMKEISSLLNFHDQSHFIKVFKKIEGITPKQFKNGNFDRLNSK